MKWLKRIALACFFLGLLFCLGTYLYFTGKVDYLVLNRGVTIQVNGVTIPGEMLGGRGLAILTRRDPGKEHSYRVGFFSDSDFTGNVGYVADCGQWVAPHLPLMVVTADYPPCGSLSDGTTQRYRAPLIFKGSEMQFASKDQSVITIVRAKTSE